MNSEKSSVIPETISSSSTTISKPDKYFLELSLKRDVGGVKLFIKSPVNFKFMAQENSERTCGGVKCFASKVETLSNVRGYCYQTGSVYDLFLYDNKPNLAILLAKDLKNGVTFNFGEFPISESGIKDWIAQFKEQAKQIYLSYCKPISYTVKFSAETVETEQHN